MYVTNKRDDAVCILKKKEGKKREENVDKGP